MNCLVDQLLTAHARNPARGTLCSCAPRLIERTLTLLFPQRAEQALADRAAIEARIGDIRAILLEALAASPARSQSADSIADQFLAQLEPIRALLLRDADAIVRGDPAAKSIDEVLVTYPGFFAVAVYRIAHALLELGAPLFPRVLTEYAHRETGIDIHPGAKIGESFCIDHGTGVVIGETTIIKENVRMYQGVTLGGLVITKGHANQKRHPTIERDVVIYANATILGGETVVGAGSVIGGNVWLTTSVEPNSLVYHKGDVTIRQTSKNPE